MTARCQILMRRVPVKDGEQKPAHASIQKCGRPVEQDGLCRFHARQRDLDDERRLWRAALRKVGR